MSDLPKSIATETLNVMGVDMVVHVLDDGQRVIEAESAAAWFRAMFGDDVDSGSAMKNVTPHDTPE